MTIAAFVQSLTPEYDETLATELMADGYGMKSSILVILKTGHIWM